jgi:hypothetical protein
MLTYIEVVGEARAEDLRDLAASLGPYAEEAYRTASAGNESHDSVTGLPAP